MTTKLIITGAIALTGWFTWSFRASANPNDQVIDAPLAVHGKEFSQDLHKEAAGLYQTASKKLFDFLETEGKNGIQKIPAKDLGETYLMVTRLNRISKQLQLLGEPAGMDYLFRTTEMHKQLRRLISASSSVPATQKYIQSVREFVAKTEAARRKVISDLEKLIAQNKWDPAEVQLYKVYDRLEPGTVFLSPAEANAIYSPFVMVASAIQGAMTEIRTAHANELLAKAVQELEPNYESLVGEINTAVNAVASSGTTTWQGESATGPQLIGALAEKWREVHVAAMQARAKHWALTKRDGVAYQQGARSAAPAAALAAPLPATGGQSGEQDRFAAAYGEFSRNVMEAIRKTIEADASRISSDQVAQQYTSYLQAIAPIVNEAKSSEFASSLNAAVAKIAEKNPSFNESVKAYSQATDDVLRWRARVAMAEATAQGKDYVDIDKRFYEGTLSNESYKGLFANPEYGERLPMLLTSAPDVMGTATKRLIGQKTTVRNVTRLPGDSKSAIAQYKARTYANVPAPLDLAAQVTALKSDLLVSEQMPPLSIAATQAVLNAERGTVSAIGGEIRRIHLEGLITRFATLPQAAAVLSPLGQMPADKLPTNGLNHMVMRFDITPEWVMHDYFFVRLAPPVETTASN